MGPMETEGVSPLDAGAMVALRRLLERLRARDYRFITPTPETHARVIARPERRRAKDLVDVLGWNLPFDPGLLDADLLGLLDAAGMLRRAPSGLCSLVRVASLANDLYLHSGFPPRRESVFFGPDTYRFVRFISEKLDEKDRVSILVDLGAGSGAGAVTAARRTSPTKVILTDVNQRALSMAQVNLAVAGVTAEFRQSAVLNEVTEEPDLIIANPPFIAGSEGRIYSDGGDMHGARASLEWVVAGSAQLKLGGRMVLYTGVAIVRGADPLFNALRRVLDKERFDITYEEIDPDIFGESLESDSYSDVDRIAAVGAVITRRG